MGQRNGNAVVTTWAAQTLTNKTLTTPTLTSPTESAAATSEGTVHWTTTTLTSAQVLAVRATPITLVAAPGSGKTLQFVQAVLFLDYGGTNGFTESTNNLQIKHKDGSGTAASEVIETTGFIDQVADTVTFVGPVFGAATLDNIIAAATAVLNQPLVLHNTSGGEIAGNAAADNVLVVKTAYRVLTLP